MAPTPDIAAFLNGTAMLAHVCRNKSPPLVILAPACAGISKNFFSKDTGTPGISLRPRASFLSIKGT
jgi:hypothetical protein